MVVCTPTGILLSSYAAVLIGLTLNAGAYLTEIQRAAGPQNAIVSSDCGVFLLPPPDEGLREFALLLESCGLTQDDLKTLMQTNPAKLFKVPPTDGPTPT